MYICAYTYVYTCVHINAYVHLYTYIYVFYIYMCGCVYIRMHNTRIYMCIGIHTRAYMHVCKSVVVNLLR